MMDWCQNPGAQVPMEFIRDKHQRHIDALEEKGQCFVCRNITETELLALNVECTITVQGALVVARISSRVISYIWRNTSKLWGPMKLYPEDAGLNTWKRKLRNSRRNWDKYSYSSVRIIE